METTTVIHDEETTPVAICIPVDDELITIFFEDILYVEANNNYCRIYCVDRIQSYMTRITVKEIEKFLPENIFQRIHESYIVALKIIKGFNSSRTRLRAGADKWLPISRRYRKILILLFPAAVSK